MRQGSVGLETQVSGTLASSLLSHVHRVPLVSCQCCQPLCFDALHDPAGIARVVYVMLGAAVLAGAAG